MLAACAALAGATLVAAARDDTPKVPDELNCPVSGAKVNVKDAIAAGHYVDREYTRYVFCCDKCPAAFKADPAKFAGCPGVPLAAIPLPETVACPVQPEHKVNVKAATAAKHFADYNGRRYYFCCGGCPGAFKADPAKFAEAESVPVGQIPLPKEISCAVKTDMKVDPARAIAAGHYADYNGRRYVFCCGGCPAAFKADPAKFADSDSLPSPKVEKKKAD